MEVVPPASGGRFAAATAAIPPAVAQPAVQPVVAQKVLNPGYGAGGIAGSCGCGD